METLQQHPVIAKLSNLSGLLPIFKPAGMTSKDVARQIERKIGKLKTGHVGTLDPIAEGVLPLLVGGATKLQDVLLELPKVYEFEVTFGIETDTLDLEGKIVSEQAIPLLTSEIIEAQLQHFRGKILQEPPLYSAIKYQGRPLYEYARRDRSDELPELKTLSREIEVFELELISNTEKTCALRLCCSKGTYVRSIARDLARRLGTVGTVTKLVRTRSAGIDIGSCVKLETLNTVADLQNSMIALENLSTELTSWKSVLPGWTKRLMNGQSLEIRQDLFVQGCTTTSFNDGDSFEQILLLSHEGQVFGLGTINRNPVQTVSVSMRRGLL